GGGGGGGGGGNRQITGLNILVGTAPGGGFDQTARTAANAMEDAKLARNVEVQNLPGAGNTIALQHLVNDKGNGKLMQQMGLGLVGGVYTNKSKATIDQTTPVARLTEEPEIVMVHKDSPYQSFDQLLSAWKADPGKLAVGGGSSPGGPDHPAPLLIAKTAGIDPKKVNFVYYARARATLPRRPRPPGAHADRQDGRDRPQEGELRLLRRRRGAAGGGARQPGRLRRHRRRRGPGPDRRRRDPRPCRDQRREGP